MESRFIRSAAQTDDGNVAACSSQREKASFFSPKQTPPLAENKAQNSPTKEIPTIHTADFVGSALGLADSRGGCFLFILGDPSRHITTRIID